MTEVKSEPLEDTFEGNGDVELLPYEQRILLDTIDEDVLFIAGRGLGIERLFLNHLIMYSDQKLLFLVINTAHYDEAYFLTELKDAVVTCQPKLINSEVSTKDRASIYLEGGVQFITSRILLVDLLTGNVPVNLVAGILVYRAHQVLMSFQESFILRLYREQKKGGMVKAFTDLPTAFSSLGQLQRVIDRLYVKNVTIIPRFHEGVREVLNHRTLNEWNISLPPTLRRVQTTIHELIKSCMRELKQCSSTATKSQDDQDMTIGVFAYSITSLEKQLLEKRSFLTEKQRRLVSDLEILRQLLRVAEDMDPATLLARLSAMKNDKEFFEKSGGWLLSPMAGRLLSDCEALCGGAKRTTIVAPPKWKVLVDILEEVKGFSLRDDEVGSKGPSVLVFVSNDTVCRQVTDLIKFGPQFLTWMCRRQVGAAGAEPPKTPLWDPEHTSMYLRANVNGEARVELVTDVQKNQKVTARAARKRRKAAEDLVGSSDGGKQTNILQFGILQYKKKNLGEASTSTPIEPKEEPIEIDEDAEPAPVRTIADFEKVPLVVTPCGEKYNTLRYLSQTQPNIVILYNSDVVTVRQLELYKACNPAIYLVVHQLQYTDSTEEERFLTSLNNETRAFEAIVREKATLLIPRTWDVEREEAPVLRVSTRDGGGRLEEPEGRPKIIVDMREFNSELPTVLYKKGFDVVAATLEVGDYVLSPGITVERKALDDLTQSLQSGRVFKQAEQMLAHYANSFLLVESNRKFESKLVNGGPFQGELTRHCRDIRAQLCALVKAFPKLKLIWSLSPMNSAEYFAELKISHEQPDLEKAVSLRGDHVPQPDGEGNKSKKLKPNPLLLRHLTQHLPEMGKGDIVGMMTAGKVGNLRGLFTQSADSLHSSIGHHSDRISFLANFDFSDKA